MSRYLLILLLLLTSLTAFSPTKVVQGSKNKYIALIIANDEYQHVGSLQEPVIMAGELEDALINKGFDIKIGFNKSQDEMEQMIKDFAKVYSDYEVALVFYLGHGIQVEGKNYLVPVDAELESKDDVDVEAVKLDYILKKLNNSKIPKAIILDACRNNPFVQNWKMEHRALVAHGLTEVKAPSNVEVYFTTNKNNTVPDGNPYLKYFIEELNKETCLDRIIKKVTKRVNQHYNGSVAPDRFGVLWDDICFEEEKEEDLATPIVSGQKKQIYMKKIDLFPNYDGFEMVFVEGNTFQMGSDEGDDREKPVHNVTLSDFYIGKYEVTQTQWKEIMGSNPSEFKDCDTCPVEKVSWNDIQEFLKKLNKKTGKNFRLPTEAEWEYAARGGNKSKGYLYSGSNILSAVGNYCDDNCKYTGKDKNANDGYSFTSPVGNYTGNELGIYDMSGNVYEWCNDWYGDYTQKNPKDADSRRVVRGGSWIDRVKNCRVVYRGSNKPYSRSFMLGFRLCLSL